MRGREQEWPGAMIEEVNQVTRSANVSTERADCLRERAHLYINPAMDVEVVDGATPVASQYAGGMGIIHHHDSAIFFGKLAKPRQRADVAIHGKYAVADEQFVAGLIFD